MNKSIVATIVGAVILFSCSFVSAEEEAHKKKGDETCNTYTEKKPSKEPVVVEVCYRVIMPNTLSHHPLKWGDFPPLEAPNHPRDYQLKDVTFIGVTYGETKGYINPSSYLDLTEIKNVEIEQIERTTFLRITGGENENAYNAEIEIKDKYALRRKVESTVFNRWEETNYGWIPSLL